MKTNGFLLILLVMVQLMLAQNYPSFPVGEYWMFPDARSLALGGAGSVSLQRPGAMLYNPAALTGISGRVTAMATLNVRKMEEHRSYPLYDRFDGVITDAIYALNNNYYYSPEGAITFRTPFATLPNLTVGVGSFIEIDQNYRYNEEVRENIFGDSLLAYNHIYYDGGLRRTSFAVAASMPFLPALSLGVQFGFLSGSLDYEAGITWVRGSRSDSLATARYRLDGTPFVISLGATYRINERVTGGLDISLPYTIGYRVRYGTAPEVREEIGYPFRINTGWEYRARQILQARLNIDFGYEFWSKSLKYVNPHNPVFNQPRDYSDVYVFKVGVEHIFFNKIPFQVGMQYRNSFQHRGTTRTLLSVGTGFLGEHWQVDVAGAVSKSEYRWPDLFDDTLYGGDRSNSSIDTVDEYYFFGKVTLLYHFNF